MRGSNGCGNPQDVDPCNNIGFVVFVVVVREHVALVVIVLGQRYFDVQTRRIQKASPANPDLANPAHTDQPAPAKPALPGPPQPPAASPPQRPSQLANFATPSPAKQPAWDVCLALPAQQPNSVSPPSLPSPPLLAKPSLPAQPT